MKKTQRILLGCAATCTCFFVTMLAGSFIRPAADLPTSADDRVINATLTGSPTTEAPDSTSSAAAPVTPSAEASPTETASTQNTLTPTPVPPTDTPTPSPSPTPTLSPTPSPSPTVTPTPTPSPTPTPAAYVPDFTISAVTTNLNIRKGPSTKDKVIGKLSGGCYALILGEENGWTKISTGSIEEGYVHSDYLFSPSEVISMCDRENLVSVTITATVLNVRSGPGTQFDSIKKVKKNQTFTPILSKSYEDWIAIRLTDDTIGYVSEAYVKFSYDMDTGLTLDEIEDIAKQKAIEEAMAKARIYNVAESFRTPVSMTEEELYLFATVIYTEAGNQKYEGQLAVANVILNRMEDGYWGTSLEEVLFAKGQFEGAKKEYIDRAQRKGIPESCYDAAREALAGRNNIGDFMFFRTTSSADRTADYVTYKVFYILEDHVFYKKDW